MRCLRSQSSSAGSLPHLWLGFYTGKEEDYYGAATA